MYLADFIKETAPAPGLSAYSLSGAVSGFAVIPAAANGLTLPYGATDGVHWETGIGTYTHATRSLARTTVKASSNGGAAVNWTGNAITLCVGLLADMLPTTYGTANQVLQGSANGVPAWAATPKIDGLIVSKAAGNGVRVDLDNPTFGWHDITAALHTRSTGSAVPTLTRYNLTSIYQWAFSNAATQELFVEFHVPHDYVPGSDLFIHTHWSQTTVDSGGAAGAPGAVKWNYDILYARGHQQAAFPNTVTTVSATQTASATIREHMIAEVQASTAGKIDGQDVEVDGVLIVRMWRDPADAADTLNVAPFAHFCDLHYQSTGQATKQKAPPFWT